MSELMKTEIYTFSKENKLIKFSNGFIEKIMVEDNKIRSKKIFPILTRPKHTIDLSIKPIVKFFDIILDFSTLDSFHHMFVDYDNHSVSVYNEKCNIVNDSFIYKMDNDVYIYNYDYEKKTLFVYTKDKNNNLEIEFRSIPRGMKYYTMVDNKYPISINKTPINFPNIYGFLDIDGSMNSGNTKIYLPKDDIEREIFFNHIIKYNIVHVEDETIITLKYFLKDNKD